MVVFIDKSHEIRDIFSVLYTEHFAEKVYCFESADEATEFIHCSAVKVLIADHYLGSTTGLELLIKFKKSDMDLILTSTNFEFEMPEHLKNRVVLYLKPYTFEKLFLIISELLDKNPEEVI